MSRIPPEIDRLMWAVAENPVPDAMDEFGQRHPELRGELLKRVEMVRGLRNEVKANGHPGRQIPKFEPKAIPPSVPPRGLYVAFALGIVAIGFAAFTALSSLRTPAPMPVVQQVPIDKPFDIPQVIVQQPQAPQKIVQTPLPSNGVTPPFQEAPAVIPLAEKRRDLNLKDVELLSALALITAQTNLKLEIGPGFVNQKVTISFRDKTTKEMLVEMAKEYAFSLSDEGNNQYLVLPVPDDGTEPTSHGNPQRRIGP